MIIVHVFCILTVLFLNSQVEECQPTVWYRSRPTTLPVSFWWLTSKCKSEMEAEIERVRVIAEACGLSGKELLEFLQKEREEKKQDIRDERSYQRELKRSEFENLQVQLRIEELKKENAEQLEIQFRIEAMKKENATATQSSSTSPSNVATPRTPKLPPFDETHDDIDAYLQRFERYARCQQWHEDNWALNLSALLKGKALEVYSRLTYNEAKHYSPL